MRIREQHLFSNGQFRQALILTPDRLPVSYRFISVLFGLGLLVASYFLISREQTHYRWIITCLCFGIFGLIFGFLRASYEIIQGKEARMRIGLGPLSMILARSPLHSGFPFQIERNDSDEIVIFANKGGSKQLHIGPFDSEAQAQEILQSLEFVELEAPENEAMRISRAKTEVQDLTSGINPKLLRLYQVALVASAFALGASTDNNNLRIASAILGLIVILITEAWITATTRVENVSEDYTRVDFSTRCRYFLRTHWAMNPVKPDSITFIRRSFNPSVITPVIVFLAGLTLLLPQQKSHEEIEQPQPLPPMSAEEQEHIKRGIDFLNQARERDKENTPDKPNK